MSSSPRRLASSRPRWRPFSSARSGSRRPERTIVSEELGDLQSAIGLGIINAATRWPIWVACARGEREWSPAILAGWLLGVILAPLLLFTDGILFGWVRRAIHHVSSATGVDPDRRAPAPPNGP